MIGGNLLCVSAMTSTFVMSSEAEPFLFSFSRRNSQRFLDFARNDKRGDGMTSRATGASLLLVSFNNFDLSPEVVRGVQAMGFAEPTPIQLRAFPIILAGKDLDRQPPKPAPAKPLLSRFRF